MIDLTALRVRWAGALLLDHKQAILDALDFRLGALIDEVRRRPDYFVKGDWRGDMHRRRVAHDIRATRNAIRDVSNLPRELAA